MIDTPMSRRLRSASAEGFEALLDHPFFTAVAEGTLSPDARDHYLIYERRFVGAAVNVFANILAEARDPAAQRHLVSILHGLANDQSALFDRLFERAAVTPPSHGQPMPPAVEGLCDGMVRLAAEGGYATGLAAMLVAESSYLQVAKRLAATPPPDPILRDWFALHAEPPFTEGVDWLVAEVDALPNDAFPACHHAFERAIELEIAFHHAPLNRERSVGDIDAEIP